MSYRNVFFGILGEEVVFNSREGDELDGSEIATYLPEIFYNHPLVKNERYGLKLLYHVLVYSPTSVGITFYLTNSSLYYEGDITSNLEQSQCNIQVHLDTEDNDMIIKWVGVNTSMRGKGLAQYLITLSLLYCSCFSEDIKKCTLDDDSDKYANGIDEPGERMRAQSKNLYCKMGFTYEDETGGPEMEGDPGILLERNIGKFIKKRSSSRSRSRSQSRSRSRSQSSSSGKKTKKKRPMTRSQTRR